MNRLVLVIAAWVVVGIETGLRPALEVGDRGIAPSFVLPLAVFIAMFATPHAASWACLILGLLVDLTSSSTPTVVGPYALSYLLLAQFVVSVRAVMMRRNPLTLGVLSAASAILVAVCVVAAYTLRRLVYGGDDGWHAGAELWVRILGSLYTGVVGVFLALLLLPATEYFGFPQESRRGRRG